MPKEINFFELPLEIYHGKLPFPLVSLIKSLIDLKAETVENIFTETKESDSAHKLINELSKGRVQDWSKYKDASSLAYVFKVYLTKLLSYEPLIPIDCFTVMSTMSSMDDLDKKINLCQSILSGLLSFKRARYALIDYIFNFFKYISAKSATNKMDAQKLSEIFTPIISHHNDASFISEEVANQCVQFLIENYVPIFENAISDPAEKQSFIMSEKEIENFRVPTLDFNLVSIAVNNCKYRQDHVIKFVPTCIFSRAKRFKRPERRPPPKPVTSTQLAVNMFDSTIQRFSDNDNNKKFLLNVRSSVTQLNPMENKDGKLTQPSPKRTKKPTEPSKSPITQKTNQDEITVQPSPSRVKTTIGRGQFQPPKKTEEKPSQPTKNEKKPENEKPVGNVKNFAKFLNEKGPMGMPIGMPMERRKTISPQIDNPAPAGPPMGMPMGGPRPTVTKDEEDSPIDKIVDQQAGQMIHRTPRRGGNRRPPKILSE